jgi:hypothetical protein
LTFCVSNPSILNETIAASLPAELPGKLGPSGGAIWAYLVLAYAAFVEATGMMKREMERPEKTGADGTGGGELVGAFPTSTQKRP